MKDNFLIRAIELYLYDKENISFETNIIRLLTYIYNEIDLINPYLLKEYDLIDQNLMRYGLKYEEILRFHECLNSYANTKDMNSFLTIYKIIMDMIEKKYKEDFISKEEVERFEKIFFAGKSVQSLKEYWDKTLYKINNKITFSKVNDTIFNPYIYYMQGKTMDDLKSMSDKEIVKLNEKILKKYNLKISDNNLTDKINKIVYRALNPIGPLTSGNGFVDILMILSFIATEILVGLVIAITLIKR